MATARLVRAPPSAPAVRAPTPLVLWSLAAAAVAASAVAVALALTSDHVGSDPGLRAALMAWVVLPYVLAGLAAWWRRPESRLGPLMVAVGFVFALTSLSWSNAGLPFTIGIAFDLLPAVLFLHLFLAFPSGRLERPLERALVGTGYVVAGGLQLVGLALDGFGPDNVLALVQEAETAYTLLRVQLVVLSGLCLAGVGVLVLRWRGAARPLRRSLALLVDFFALGLVMIAFLYLSGAFGLIEGQTMFETIRRATFFVMGLAPLAFLAGLLQARLARSAVADLFVELDGEPAPGRLRDALARALRDPSLTLLYWLPEYASWADVDGRPMPLDDGEPGRTTTVIRRERDPLAALVHDASLGDEPELLESVSAAAALALENARLNVELRARLHELKGSRARIVEAGDAERRRLERDLHDGAQQRMVAVALQLRLLESCLHRDPAAAERLVRSASQELALSLAELRELARGIHPAVLEQGLKPALGSLAARAAVATEVVFEAPGRLPEPVERAAYFVASEALANVAKYAHATAVTIRVTSTGGLATVAIADDGIGGADDTRGSGLRGLADRVEALDGHLRVSSPAGGGTVVCAELPCGS